MISIVIPNYNGEDNLKSNLPKISKLIKDNELVIVDDKSTDGSIKVVLEFISKNKNLSIKLIESPNNKGFSSTVNKGVNASSGEIVVLLNTDAFIKTDLDANLLEKFEDEKVFAVGFLDESHEEGKIVLRGRGIGSWKRGFLVHAKGTIERDNSLWASGGSSAFSKKIWDRIGGLNELYNPFYWEDLDISYRALRSGYKVLFNRDIVVVHEHEKGIIRKKFSQSQIKKIAFRNQFILVWINGTVSNLVQNVLWFPYYVLKSIKSGDLEFISGFFQALALAPRAFSSRRKVQKLFVKGDREVQVLE